MTKPKQIQYVVKHEHYWLLKRFIDICFGLALGIVLSANVIFAKQIDYTKAGVSVWIFLAVGTFIICLQAIPAFIFFTLFISNGLKKRKDK